MYVWLWVYKSKTVLGAFCARFDYSSDSLELSIDCIALFSNPLSALWYVSFLHVLQSPFFALDFMHKLKRYVLCMEQSFIFILIRLFLFCSNGALFFHIRHSHNHRHEALARIPIQWKYGKFVCHSNWRAIDTLFHSHFTYLHRAIAIARKKLFRKHSRTVTVNRLSNVISMHKRLCSIFAKAKTKSIHMCRLMSSNWMIYIWKWSNAKQITKIVMDFLSLIRFQGASKSILIIYRSIRIQSDRWMETFTSKNRFWLKWTNGKSKWKSQRISQK